VPRDITKLARRNAELESAIDDIRNAWAHFHSVGGACSRDEWVHAINVTEKAVNKVWRPRR
jgi:hypothetical protein